MSGAPPAAAGNRPPQLPPPNAGPDFSPYRHCKRGTSDPTTSIKRTRLPGWAKLLTAVVILIVVLLAALRLLVFGGLDDVFGTELTHFVNFDKARLESGSRSAHAILTDKDKAMFAAYGSYFEERLFSMLSGLDSGSLATRFYTGEKGGEYVAF